MGALILIVCFAFKTLIWDIVLRSARFCNPRGALSFYNRYSKKMSLEAFKLLTAFTGLRLTVSSVIQREIPKTFILVSNHQSLYDIPAIIIAFPDHDIKFIAKQELSRFVPFVSVGLKMGKHALISRAGDGYRTRYELKRLARLSQKGFCPHVFPEGTRSRTGEVGRFHTAALRSLIRDTELPVLTAAIDGGYHMSSLLDMTHAGKEKLYRVKLLSLRPNPKQNVHLNTFIQEIRHEIVLQLDKWHK